MKKNILKRSSSMLLALIMCMVFTVSATSEVEAASTKNFKVVYKTVYTFDNGEGPTKSTTTHTYNSKGLRTSTKTTGDTKVAKTTYKTNSKGYVTKSTYYDAKGKKMGYTNFTVKSNGDVSKEKYYEYSGSKAKLKSTTSYAYYSKGKLKQIKTKATDKSSDLMKFNKKGHMTMSLYSNGKTGDDKLTYKMTYKYTYDKKGNPTKETGTDTTTFGNETTKETFVTTNKYTYNKKGLPTKIVSKTTNKEGGKVTSTSTETTKNTYSGKYITKSSSTRTYKNDYSTNTYKSSMTYTYKTIKVAKKYWKLYQ